MKKLNLRFYDEINKFDKIKVMLREQLLKQIKTQADDVYYLTKIFENNTIRNLIQKTDPDEYVRDFDPVEMSQIKIYYTCGAHKYLTEVNLITRKTKYKYGCLLC